MRNAFLPIALIIVGAGWLLKELHLFPDASWIAIIGLIVAGVLGKARVEDLLDVVAAL